MANHLNYFAFFLASKEILIFPAEEGWVINDFTFFSPDEKPTWHKADGGSIDWTRVMWGTNFNKSLKMENVGFQDEGTYECVTPNRLTRQFKVQINGKFLIFY